MSWEPGGDLYACAQTVERGDRERFVATMAAPVAARAVLFPLYAFNVEVSRAPWVTQEPMIAQMRLQWWTDALGEIGAGGFVRRHEVVTSLVGCLDREGLQLLEALVEARHRDIETAPFDDAAALIGYLEQTAGGLMQAAARGLGDRDGRAARALGTASGMAAYLLAVPELVSRGKLPLPDGRPEAVQALARSGLKALLQARSLRHTVPASARCALLPGWLAKPVLERAAQDPDAVGAGALMPSEAARRLRRLWVTTTGRF